jgi:hypothetical protein
MLELGVVGMVPLLQKGVLWRVRAVLVPSHA